MIPKKYRDPALLSVFQERGRCVVAGATLRKVRASKGRMVPNGNWEKS
jgi:hypothetical protein